MLICGLALSTVSASRVNGWADGSFILWSNWLSLRVCSFVSAAILVVSCDALELLMICGGKAYTCFCDAPLLLSCFMTTLVSLFFLIKFIPFLLESVNCCRPWDLLFVGLLLLFVLCWEVLFLWLVPMLELWSLEPFFFWLEVEDWPPIRDWRWEWVAPLLWS